MAEDYRNLNIFQQLLNTLKLCVLATILFLLTNIVFAEPSHTYVNAEVGNNGLLKLITDQGLEIIPDIPSQHQNLGKPTGYDQIQISKDGKTIGWVELYPNCCASYSLPLRLVLFSQGSISFYIGNGTPIWKWHFLPNSSQFAFRQEHSHGGTGINYELRKLDTGKLTSNWAQEYDMQFRPNLSQTKPDWVKAFDEIN